MKTGVFRYHCVNTMFTKVYFDEFESKLIFEIDGSIVAQVPAEWIGARYSESSFQVSRVIDAMGASVVGEYRIGSVAVEVTSEHTVIGNVVVGCSDSAIVRDALREYQQRLLPCLPSASAECTMARNPGSPKCITIEHYESSGKSRGLITITPEGAADMLKSAMECKESVWSHLNNNSCNAHNVRAASLPSVIECINKAIIRFKPKKPSVDTPTVITATIDNYGTLKIIENGITVYQTTLSIQGFRELYRAIKSGDSVTYQLSCCGIVIINYKLDSDIVAEITTGGTSAKSACHSGYTIQAKYVNAVKLALTEVFDV